MRLTAICLLLFAFAAGASAQEDGEKAPLLFDRADLLQNYAHKLPLHDLENDDQWVLLETMAAWSSTWIATRLSTKGTKSGEKRRKTQEKSPYSGEMRPRYHASFRWFSSENPQISVQYKGSWRECNANESYHFKGVTVHDV